VAKDKAGRTPIALAAEEDQLEVVKVLAARNANRPRTILAGLPLLWQLRKASWWS
jgi:hypothetical protein